MSDLQCAVTVLVAAAAPDQAPALVASVAHQRVASVWCSDEEDAVGTARLAADELGLLLTEREGLRADPGADRASAVARVRTALNEVADTHRGETALLVTRVPVLAQVLPVLARNLRADHAAGHPLPAGAVVELAGDSDGWVCRSWAGHRYDGSGA